MLTGGFGQFDITVPSYSHMRLLVYIVFVVLEVVLKLMISSPVMIVPFMLHWVYLRGHPATRTK